MDAALPADRAGDPARPWLAMVLTVSLGALAVALVGQFGFGLRPCILCLYARIPYLAAAIIAAVGLLPPLAARQRRRLLGLAGLAFAAGALLALYHVGIEERWWTSAVPGCTGTPVGAMSPADLRAGILAPQRACDEVDFRLAGLSLAAWNALASAGLAVACFVAGRRLTGKEFP